MASPPTFSPLPPDALHAAFPDDSDRRHREAERTSWSSLSLLSDTTFNSLVPYGWGFTIYRIHFEGDSDERFQNAVRRFELWVKWLVRAVRYGNDNVREMFTGEDGCDPTDQLADRMYNQVIRFDPSQSEETIVSEPEGEEDFYAVGCAFSKWVADLGVDLAASRGNARYDQCLIIDKTAVESLEKLPDTLPPLEHYARTKSHSYDIYNIYYNTWVWVLDRKSNETLAVGENLDYSPWLRLRISYVPTLWFERPKRKIPQDWKLLTEEDRYKWETVAWWNPQATLVNSVLRQTRGKKPFEGLFDDL